MLTPVMNATAAGGKIRATVCRIGLETRTDHQSKQHELVKQAKSGGHLVQVGKRERLTKNENDISAVSHLEASRGYLYVLMSTVGVFGVDIQAVRMVFVVVNQPEPSRSKSAK